MTRARPLGLAVRAMLAALILVAVAAVVALPMHFFRQRSEWRQVFYEDFSHGLQPSRWGVYSGQPGGDPGGWWAPSHAVVRHTVLNLESYRDPAYGGRWVSAGISSAPALKQTYGKYEVRVRMDAGKGVAFVALLWPVRDVWPPEVDFAENAGEAQARQSMFATLHYGPSDSQLTRTFRLDFTRWHTLGVEWRPGRLIYTVDGRRWAVTRSREVPAQGMALDLQTQTGTCGRSLAPCPDSTTPSHVNAQINWVAAYAYQGAR